MKRDRPSYCQERGIFHLRGESCGNFTLAIITSCLCWFNSFPSKGARVATSTLSSHQVLPSSAHFSFTIASSSSPDSSSPTVALVLSVVYSGQHKLCADVLSTLEMTVLIPICIEVELRHFRTSSKKMYFCTERKRKYMNIMLAFVAGLSVLRWEIENKMYCQVKWGSGCLTNHHGKSRGQQKFVRRKSQKTLAWPRQCKCPWSRWMRLHYRGNHIERAFCTH